MNKIFPKFIHTVSGYECRNALKLIGTENNRGHYWRYGGGYWVTVIFKGDKLVVSPQSPFMSGIEFTECTEEDWKLDNYPYITEEYAPMSSIHSKY